MADAAGRKALVDDIQQYTLRLFLHLATSPALPAALRAQMLSMRLCAAEWPDSAHLPWIPYVREGRRMRNTENVFTQVGGARLQR